MGRKVRVTLEWIEENGHISKTDIQHHDPSAISYHREGVHIYEHGDANPTFYFPFPGVFLTVAPKLPDWITHLKHTLSDKGWTVEADTAQKIRDLDITSDEWREEMEKLLCEEFRVKRP